jgi:hypothetical protein
VMYARHNMYIACLYFKFCFPFHNFNCIICFLRLISLLQLNLRRFSLSIFVFFLGVSYVKLHLSKIWGICGRYTPVNSSLSFTYMHTVISNKDTIYWFLLLLYKYPAVSHLIVCKQII